MEKQLSHRDHRGHRGRRAGVFLCVLCALCGAFLRAARADRRDIDADGRYLASDALEGRATGSPGAESAAAYIQRRLREMGLEPVRQAFDVVAGVTVAAETSLAFGAAGGADAPPLALGRDYTPLGFSANGDVRGEVFFCGYGITAPELGYDDYALVDVRGKVALVLDRVPGAGDPHAAPFAPAGLSRYGQIRYKALNAREHGAAALIVVSSSTAIGNDEYSSLLAVTGNTSHGDAGIIVLDLKRKVAADLVAASGRSLDQYQGRIDAERVARSFLVAPAPASLSVRMVKERRRSANVIAVRPGTDPALRDEVIVLGAHYDHLGRGEVGGSLAESAAGKEVHNGADDNASGTAALLEVARTLRPTRRTLVFAAFSGEEMGLLGSAHYVKEPPEAAPLGKTVAMINMDMVGRLEKKKLTIGGMGTAAEWPELVSGVARAAGIELTAQDDGYGPSDHSSFYGKDVPVLFLFTGAHPDYHRPGDDWDKVDVPGVERVAGFARELCEAIDARDARPTYRKTAGNPHGGEIEPGRGPQVYLGTIPDYSESEAPGVRLTGVREGSPGEKAGLEAGDVIVRFDGVEVRNVHDYTYALFAKKPGDEVEIVVLRGKERVTLKATLGKKGK